MRTGRGCLSITGHVRTVEQRAVPRAHTLPLACPRRHQSHPWSSGITRSRFSRRSSQIYRHPRPGKRKPRTRWARPREVRSDDRETVSYGAAAAQELVLRELESELAPRHVTTLPGRPRSECTLGCCRISPAGARAAWPAGSWCAYRSASAWCGASNAWRRPPGRVRTIRPATCINDGCGSRPAVTGTAAVHSGSRDSGDDVSCSVDLAYPRLLSDEQISVCVEGRRKRVNGRCGRRAAVPQQPAGAAGVGRNRAGRDGHLAHP